MTRACTCPCHTPHGTPVSKDFFSEPSQVYMRMLRVRYHAQARSSRHAHTHQNTRRGQQAWRLCAHTCLRTRCAHTHAQASLSCSISSTAAISNPGSLGGLEGKEVRGWWAVSGWLTARSVLSVCVVHPAGAACVVLTHSTATPPLPACQVFTEKKGLNIFKDKTLRVRRIYDSSRQSLVYVAYSTRLSNAADEKTMSSGRYRTSVCALQLPGQQTSSSGALASAPAVAAGVQ